MKVPVLRARAARRGATAGVSGRSRTAGTAALSAALALSAAACTSRTTTTTTLAQDPAIGAGCTPEDACGGCSTCLDECRCGGGTLGRCAEVCGAEGVPGTDGGAPPAGELATTLVTQAFDVPPGEELYRCQDFANPFGADVAVLNTESFMTSGSHHMFVFRKPGATDGELAPCSGLEFTDYLHSTQRSQDRFDYPEGVGRWLGGTEGLRVQVHFLNASSDTVHAEIAVTLRATAPENVTAYASNIFINTLSINVPPHSEGGAHPSCSVPKDVNVFTGVSHMHQHGVAYTARADDGQLLFETKQWAEPNPWRFTPPRKLKAGTRIQVDCAYRNDTDQALGFGESADTNEMCIFVGQYYPAEPGEGITCLF